MTPPLLGIAGMKNAGKTTLVVALVEALVKRGVRVATVKHAHHSVQIDQEGRDSHRHRMAGASETALVTGRRWAIMGELRGAPEPTLEEIVARLGPCDIVIVEGYKSLAFPKIEVRRAAAGHAPLLGQVQNIIAVASDGEIADCPVRVLPVDCGEAIADFVIAHFTLQPGG
ncbi:MAG: molybdopterin-guanine dinucleotide biosynthesis protein B [Alphaproteobacteria bacterium]